MATSDEVLIEQAYEELVRSLFGNFHTGRVLAGAAKDPKAAELEAEHAFQYGVTLAKASRDRALKLLDGKTP
jgi:hypothetical protein